MEQQKTKLNKTRVTMTIVNIIMVAIIIILSIVIGVNKNTNDTLPPKPKPQPKWNINFSDTTDKIFEKGIDYYLSLIPDSYEDVNVTYNDIFNLDNEWTNSISLTINNELETSGAGDDSINVKSTITATIKQSENNQIYLIDKNIKPDIEGGFDAIPKESKIKITGGEKYLTYFLKDQKLLENRITDITVFSEIINPLQNYNLVIDNNNDGFFDECEVVESNEVYEQLQQAHNISLRVNLLNEWKPKIKLILK